MNTPMRIPAVIGVSAALLAPMPATAVAEQIAHAESYATTLDAQGNQDQYREMHVTLDKRPHQAALLRFTGKVIAHTAFEQPDCIPVVGIAAEKGDKYIALTPALGGCATSTEAEANPSMVTSYEFRAPTVKVTKAVMRRAASLKKQGYDITLRGDSAFGTVITEAPAF